MGAALPRKRAQKKNADYTAPRRTEPESERAIPPPERRPRQCSTHRPVLSSRTSEALPRGRASDTSRKSDLNSRSQTASHATGTRRVSDSIHSQKLRMNKLMHPTDERRSRRAGEAQKRQKETDTHGPDKEPTPDRTHHRYSGQRGGTPIPGERGRGQGGREGDARATHAALSSRDGAVSRSTGGRGSRPPAAAELRRHHPARGEATTAHCGRYLRSVWLILLRMLSKLSEPM